MISPQPITRPQTRSKGFSLMELSIAIMFGMMIASVGLTMINQQSHVMTILNQQEFILEEAPMINRSLVSILNKADAIRLHTSFNQAIADTGAVTADASVMVVSFKNPDNTRTFGLITVETSGGRTSLNYYYHDPAGTAPTAGNPAWSISDEIAGASFSLVEGLFQIRLTGPNAEVITYTISPDQ